ncbi:MAG: hypothetical protein WAK01_11415 [Methylocystis sp.]
MRVLLAMAALPLTLFYGLARAEEDKGAVVDTEHIFGFTEGTDIGEKGEHEFEVETVGLGGKPGGFLALGTQSAFRYGVEDGFRASLAVITDYHGVYNSPGLDDRKFYGFGGVATEFRWTLLDREKEPFGMVLSFAPQWRNRDATDGSPIQSYTMPIGLLFDKALIPKTVYAAINLYFDPNFQHANGNWSVEKPLEFSIAASYQIIPRVFVGLEARHLAQNTLGFMRERALFFGPSLYLRVNDTTNLKFGWSAQVSDETTGHLDLVNYERHQFIVQFATGF